MTDTTLVPDYIGHRQRLKERFLTNGGQSMPDYELLELLLMLAIPRRDVKPMAKALLRRFGSFAKVIHASKAELYAISGIKESSYLVFQMIVAAIERCSWENLHENGLPILLTQDALLDYCRTAISFSDVEELHLIYLNPQLQVIGQELMQRGTYNAVSIHPREIAKAALSQQAASVIMIHNHPSGDVTPSQADIQITRKVCEACNVVGVEVTDHLIISQADSFSFRAHRLILNEVDE